MWSLLHMLGQLLARNIFAINYVDLCLMETQGSIISQDMGQNVEKTFSLWVFIREK